MDHPDITSALANIRYDGLLQEAEMYRRINMLKRSNRVPHVRVASVIGDALIALGFRIRSQRAATA
jgi:hypothetical protein